MPKPAASSVIDDIAGAIKPSLGLRPWWERTDKAHAETLAAIHDAWKAGRFGRKKYPAARAIGAKLSELGIASVGPQGVIAWLDRAES